MKRMRRGMGGWAALAALVAAAAWARGQVPPSEPDLEMEDTPAICLEEPPARMPAAPSLERVAERAGEKPEPTRDPPSPPSGPETLEAEWRLQWNDLVLQLESRDWFEKIADQVYRPEATVLETDRDPVDLVLRRTAALLVHTARRWPKPEWAAFGKDLKTLKARADTTPVARTADRYALFTDACRLRRRVALAHPLLDFDRLLFIKKHFSRASHMCDQYFGKNAKSGGGLHILSNFKGDAPVVTDVLAGATVANGRLAGRPLEDGCFVAPDLSWDGREVVFAWCECDGGGWSETSCFHLFKANIDGSNLVQLTDGPWNDFDPCFLPSGRLCFNSERRGGFGRCHGRPVPTYTLHSMNPDGSDIVPVSYHETNEWHPSVTDQGLVVYSRWDYVDRDSDIAHHPWITTPDGRDARSLHGNFPKRHGRQLRPWMELDVKPIPGSHRYLATAAPHHGQAFGSLVMVDPDIEDDDVMSQVKRVTPETPFPESERGRGNWVFATSWPLSEDVYLAAYAPRDPKDRGRRGVATTHGLYVVDSFGNRTLLYRDPDINCQSPLPLRARRLPPVVTHLADAGRPNSKARAAAEPTILEATKAMPGDSAHSPKGLAPGTFAVMDVYDGLLDWPEGTTITALRVVQLYPKATAPSNRPRIGIGNQSLARGVLGVVPVEADGSAYFEAPAGRALYFQALDEKGLAVQSMRSLTYLQPGQRLACQGCHEIRNRAPAVPREVPLALRRPPSKLEGDVDGSNPVLYPRLVQPVLDRKCVACHTKQKKAPDLSGKVATGKDARSGWTQSYTVLARHGFWQNGGNGAIRDERHGLSRNTPGAFGAYASPLYKRLATGHHGVQLTDAERYRLTLWLDTNTNFYGAYFDLEKQARGEVVWPRLE